jgi:hypothetical protein
VLLDEHERVATPPFRLTDTQYTHRLGNPSDKHDAVITAALPLLTLGVTSAVDTVGSTVSTTHRTVRGDRSTVGTFTAHTVRLCAPSDKSARANDDDDSDTTIHEYVCCAPETNAPLLSTLRTVTLCGPVASGPTRSLLLQPANDPPSSEYSNHDLRAVEFSSKSP